MLPGGSNDIVLRSKGFRSTFVELARAGSIAVLGSYGVLDCVGDGAGAFLGVGR